MIGKIHLSQKFCVYMLVIQINKKIYESIAPSMMTSLGAYLVLIVI